MIKVSIPAQQERDLKPHIAVIGVGGAGGNAVDNMITSELEGVNFAVCNTDAQALKKSLCDKRVQLGTDITQGLGAGSDPEVGRAAAEESIQEVISHLEGMNMVFITCGMGGGTGTGAAPVIARAAREKGLLTVGVVTKPFEFEGSNRMKLAEKGIEEMQEYVDTLIVIPNQNLFRIANDSTTFAEAFKMADGVLQSGVRGVTDLMIKPGMINLDFADVRCTMQEMGKAMMGTGEASGENRAIEAAEAAISNPLLDDISMKGAQGVIINITGGYDMTLMEVRDVCDRIRDEIDDSANIIFGSTFDDRLEGTIRVSVVATGIEAEDVRKSKPLRPATMNIISTQDENAPQRVTPIAESNKTDIETGGVSSIMTGQPGQGKMPSAMPGGIPSAPSFHDMPQQKVAGSDISYNNQATSANNSAITSGFNSGAPAAPSMTQTGYAEALRGQRHGTAFIPPKPMEAGEELQPQTSSQTAPQSTAPFGFNTESTQKPVISTEPKPQGLKLNPPKLPTPDEPRQKPQSLFERMQGMVKHFTGQDETEDFGVSKTESPKAPAAKAPQMPTQAPTSQGYNPEIQKPAQQNYTMPAGQEQQNTGFMQAEPPIQGQLDMDMPMQAKSEENQTDLEIPAFLRRQAN
jgi:cell division protein FtsZ